MDARVRTRALALMVVGAVVGAGLVAAPSQAYEGDPVITWPSVTRFNPDLTDYVIESSYSGPHSLFVVLQHSGLPTAQPLTIGRHVVSFPDSYDGSVRITVAICAEPPYEDARCGELEDRTVYPYDELVVRTLYEVVKGPRSTFPISFDPDNRSGTTALEGEGEWEIVPAGEPEATPLLSGAITDVGQDGTAVVPALGGTEALVHGQRYRFQVTMRANVEPYGDLEGAVSQEFKWDGAVTAIGIEWWTHDGLQNKDLEDVDVFYPADDPRFEWRDFIYLDLRVRGSETLHKDVTITGADGHLVWERHGEFMGPWRGRNAEGDLVPEGVYDITVSVADRYGNQQFFQKQVRVSHEKILQRTWEKTIRPKPYLVDKYVGRCAALKSPARRGWEGSHGFRSKAGCGNPRTQSVSAVYGIYLPRSEVLGNNYGRYDRVRVTTYGGAPRGAKRSYLMSGYWSDYHNQWMWTREYDGTVGAHPGRLSNSRIVNGAENDDSPYILWSAGLSAGAEFDIKSFTVTARYWDVG